MVRENEKPSSWGYQCRVCDQVYEGVPPYRDARGARCPACFEATRERGVPDRLSIEGHERESGKPDVEP